MASPLLTPDEVPNPFLKVFHGLDTVVPDDDDGGILRFSIGLSNESLTEGIHYKITTSHDLAPSTSATPNPGWIAPGETISVRIETIYDIDTPLKFGVRSDLVPSKVPSQYEMNHVNYKYKNYFKRRIGHNLEATFEVAPISPGRILRSGRRSHVGKFNS